MKDKMIKKRFSKNFMASPDITAFCLELRKSFLKSKSVLWMTASPLIKKLIAEIVANKEKNETSKRHVMITCGDKE